MGMSNYGAAGANPGPPRGNVDAVIAELGDKFVSPIFELHDGSELVLHAKGLEAVRIPPLNPTLPEWVKEALSVVEPASFKDYVRNYKSETGICLASLSHNRIEAILDYHGRSREGERAHALPQPGTHRVTLLCPFDLDYVAWRSRIGAPMAQADFAVFIEDVIHTIAEPAAADLLEAISDLRIDRSVRFKSARNMRDGTVKFAFEEDDADADTGGEVTLPQMIKVVVPIFQGADPIMLEVKLRYVLKSGVLAFVLALPGREKLEREQFRRIGESVRDDTATPVFYTS